MEKVDYKSFTDDMLSKSKDRLAHLKRLYQYYHDEHPLLEHTTVKGEDDVSFSYKMEIHELERLISTFEHKEEDNEPTNN